MALIQAQLALYVSEGYVAAGYVEGQPITAAFSSTISGELVTPGVVHSAELAVDAQFTNVTTAVLTVIGEVAVTGAIAADITVFAQRTGDIDVNSNFALDTQAVLNVIALADIGFATSWSAQGSPVYGAELDLSSTISADISASVTNNTNAALEFTTELAVDSAVDIRAELDLISALTTTTQAAVLLTGSTDVNTAVTTSIGATVIQPISLAVTVDFESVVTPYFHRQRTVIVTLE